jgi:hypothetical protein
MNTILTSAMVDSLMPQAATNEQAAPCPVCNTDMVLAAITPHPVAQQLARHTYLCAKCNQTKTYILPHDERAASPNGGDEPEVESHERRRERRETLDTPATIYDKGGNFLVPCKIRDLSKTGGRLELFKEAILPQYFLMSLLPDGSGRRLCSRVWQLALIAGVRFVDKERI